MTLREEGFLLLCCRLEDAVTPLTQPQYRALYERVRGCRMPGEGPEPLSLAHLRRIGCGEALAEQVLELLGRREQIRRRLEAWARRGVAVCSRFHPDYPLALEQKLRDDTAAALFLRGPAALLNTPAVSLVGARALREENARFAAAVGRAAARCGLTLVSGNARGADTAAQQACLDAGGSVVSYLATSLLAQAPRERVLYVSEDGPDCPFRADRALRRNRLIHAHGRAALVAQVTEGAGGTWRGTADNLKRGLSPVYVFEDGSGGARALERLGAVPLALEAVEPLLARLSRETPARRPESEPDPISSPGGEDPL